ncbi:uncharacterized protein [Apostichopus japonicus]|uniref:uncharacterized protein isoform X1 n=1 Tax=Stichopus japonicus TaxID=307972 RepID=UPI003AB57341
MEMEKQPPQQQYVQTTQPNQGYQPNPHVVVVQSPAPQNSGGATGALVFSVITLICCPWSFLFTIPALICAIMANNDNSDLARTFTRASFIATALFYVAFVISIIVFVIWLVVSAKAVVDTISDSFDYSVFNNAFDDSFFN